MGLIAYDKDYGYNDSNSRRATVMTLLRTQPWLKRARLMSRSRLNSLLL